MANRHISGGGAEKGNPRGDPISETALAPALACMGAELFVRTAGEEILRLLDTWMRLRIFK
jgi:hypothetical protein